MTSLLFALVLAAAPPSPELLREAQEALAKGETAVAIEKYEAARSADPESSALTYNLAVAKYRSKAYREAATLFRDAAAGAPAPLAAKAMFNQATSIYAGALETITNPQPTSPPASPSPAPTPAPSGGASQPSGPSLDPKAIKEAIEILEQSMTNFRDAIKADPSDVDSRVNAEKAWKLLQSLKQLMDRQEKKNEENKDKNQQNQDQKDQNQKSQNQKNQDQKNQDQKSQDQKDQDKEQQKSDQQKQDDQKQQQQQQQQKQDQQKQQDGKGDEKKDEKKDGQQSDRQQDQKANQKPDQKADQKQDQKQDQSGGKDQQSKENKERPADAQQDQQQDPKDAQAQRVRVSQQDAERLLQMVRDKEKQRRAALLARQRGKQPPVSRDW